MLQVRIGSGRGTGIAFRGGPGGIISTVTDPSNWIYVAAIAVLLLIVIVLAVLVIREFHLRKKK